MDKDKKISFGKDLHAEQVPEFKSYSKVAQLIIRSIKGEMQMAKKASWENDANINELPKNV